MIKILGLDKKVEIHPVTSDHFKKEYFADRPLCERLINRKLNNREVNIMRDWREALKEYLDNYYKGYIES